MKLDATTWILAGLVLSVFLVLNLICWQPGIGGTRSGPPGAELERYFGWPAQYRAELWHSEDVELLHKLFVRAPFYQPHGEMDLKNRYLGWKAVAVNCSFGVIIVFLVGLFNERGTHSKWNWKTVSIVILAGLALFFLYWIAPTVQVSL